MQGPISLTVEAKVRWWVKPLLRGIELALNLAVWIIEKYGLKVRVP